MTSPGRLRERVTIEAPQRAGDGAGGWTIAWSRVATVWADVISFKGTELAEADRLEAREPFRVVIHHRGDVKSDMRLTWRGRVLDIRGAFDPDGRRRWLAIDCEERGQ